FRPSPPSLSFPAAVYVLMPFVLPRSISHEHRRKKAAGRHHGRATETISDFYEALRANPAAQSTRGRQRAARCDPRGAPGRPRRAGHERRRGRGGPPPQHRPLAPRPPGRRRPRAFRARTPPRTRPPRRRPPAHRGRARRRPRRVPPARDHADGDGGGRSRRRRPGLRDGAPLGAPPAGCRARRRPDGAPRPAGVRSGTARRLHRDAPLPLLRARRGEPAGRLHPPPRDHGRRPGGEGFTGSRRAPRPVRRAGALRRTPRPRRVSGPGTFPAAARGGIRPFVLQREAAPGIHRVEDAHTNWYIVEEGGALTVVDAGVRTSWRSFWRALDQLGRHPVDVAAIVLTHAHFDHIGFAERARRELGVPVLVHENDVPLSRRPRQYSRERSPLRYPFEYPESIPFVLSFVLHRAFFPQPIEHVHRFRDGTLDVPGSPSVVPTPGHTLGHCAFH